jgi:hypothetical protein
MDITLARDIVIFISGLFFLIGFPVLVIATILLFSKIKNLLDQAEKMSVEITGLIIEIRKITENIEEKFSKISGVFNTSRSVIRLISTAARFGGRATMTKTAGILALVPAFKFGWKQIKKLIGGKKNGR